jgi:hypothetical protein
MPGNMLPMLDGERLKRCKSSVNYGMLARRNASCSAERETR